MTAVYRSQGVAPVEAAEPPAVAGAPAPDRYLDLLLAGALVAVVVVHQTGRTWIPAVLPAMGVLAGVGGARIAATGGAIAPGLRRLVAPVWAMGVVLVPVMFAEGWRHHPGLEHLALWGAPLFEPPTSAWGAPASPGLLGVVAFVWLVLLSPLLIRVPRGVFPIATVVPLAVLWGADHLLGAAPHRVGSVVTAVVTVAPCWLLGVARGRGELRTVPWWVVVPIAVAAVGGGLAWTITHSSGMPLDPTPHPVASAVGWFGVALVLLRAAPDGAWLSRSRALDRFVGLCGARAVTVLVWHGIVFALVPRAANLLPENDMGIVWRVAASVVILVGLALAPILVFGWVEDVAAYRPARLRPWGSPATGRPKPETPEWSGPIWFQ